VVRFGRYRLDPVQGLRRGSDEVRVTPKSLSLLCFLVERAGQIVTKEEILHAVWRDTAVSDSALTSCIQELRQVLEDNARKPRFVETLHRRGYRFVARISHDQRSEAQAVPVSFFPANAPFVGREAAMRAILRCWTEAKQGSRQVLFVTGEAGIGKTSVVSAFLGRARAEGSIRTTWAQCVPHFGVGEAYEPLLEAVTRLCRQPDGDTTISILERCGPTWLAQLPALLTPERFAAMQRLIAGTTRERMFRELTDFLEAVTAQIPMVLWLEDLHWSDTSTLDWIGAFAKRPEAARILLIGTFRSSEIADTKHPLAGLFDELRLRSSASK
jgi:DNA-binding winged helix-turn-helix (wHTH) protein